MPAESSHARPAVLVQGYLKGLKRFCNAQRKVSEEVMHAFGVEASASRDAYAASTLWCQVTFFLA